MNANKTVDQDPFMPAIILGATILGASMAWAIGRPSQLVAILVVALMSTTVLFALRKGSRELPLILFLVFGIVFTLGVGSPAWDARSIWLFHAKRRLRKMKWSKVIDHLLKFIAYYDSNFKEVKSSTCCGPSC
jgi:hypothetical protein